MKSERGRAGKPFTLYLSEQQWDTLNKIAEYRRMSKAAIVRFAIENVLRELKPSNHKTKHLGIVRK